MMVRLSLRMMRMRRTHTAILTTLSLTKSTNPTRTSRLHRHYFTTQSISSAQVNTHVFHAFTSICSRLAPLSASVVARLVIDSTKNSLSSGLGKAGLV